VLESYITTTKTTPQQAYLIKGLADFQMAQQMHHQEVHVMDD
jgi:hypothetical protein